MLRTKPETFIFGQVGYFTLKSVSRGLPASSAVTPAERQRAIPQPGFDDQRRPIAHHDSDVGPAHDRLHMLRDLERGRPWAAFGCQGRTGTGA